MSECSGFRVQVRSVFEELRLAGGIVKRGVCPEGWSGWADVISAWINDAQEDEIVYLVVALLLLGWIVARRRIRRYLAKLGESAATSAQVKIWPTVQTLLTTMLFAAAGTRRFSCILAFG